MIPPVKKILYATDLSKNSAYAFYFAVDLAQRRGAKILILHTVEPMPSYFTHYGKSVLDKIEQSNINEAIEEIKKRLKALCQSLETQSGLPCTDLVSDIIVRKGYPVEEILETVEKEACDLIVMGTHGKGFLKQTFLGSVSGTVLGRTRKPVFIIPLPPEEVEMGWDWDKTP